MSTLNSVTVVIKARNESRQIAAAIESARLLVDDVVVVDDSSTDETARIALSLGAHVLPGIDHGGRVDLLDKQGFMAVQTPWILRMDADERLTPELAKEMRMAMNRDSVSAISYARLNYMFGDFIRWGGWFEPHQVGLFRSSRWDRDWSGDLHTQVPVTGEIEIISPTRAWMIHMDYDNIDTFIERSLRRYAASEAAEMHSKGVRFSRRRILLDPFLRIWGRYFIRRGYRDGERGLVVAGMLGAYDLARWSLLWERASQNLRD